MAQLEDGLFPSAVTAPTFTRVESAEEESESSDEETESSEEEETASLSSTAVLDLLQEQEEEQQRREQQREREQKDQNQYARDRTKKWVESLARQHGSEPKASSQHLKPTTTTTTTKRASSSQPAAPLQKRPKLDNHDNNDNINKTTTASRRKQDKKPPQEKEKRLRRFRSKPPASFQVKLQRAKSQRMIVLGRRRMVKDGAPCEILEIVGSTGNVYEVLIDRSPTCTCPDALKGNECKHKVYAMHTVLKAPEHLQYQLALLTSELEEIFANAAPLPSEVGTNGDGEDDSKGKRKPTEGECPICYMDLEPESNKLVWCKAQCGHNLHKSCFDQWVASMAGTEVRCVYCRATWEVDVGDAEAVKKAGHHGTDGYVNVAEQFGMSGARDYSSYHQPWVRRQFGGGA